MFDGLPVDAVFKQVAGGLYTIRRAIIFFKKMADFQVETAANMWMLVEHEKQKQHKMEGSLSSLCSAKGSDEKTEEVWTNVLRIHERAVVEQGRVQKQIQQCVVTPLEGFKIGADARLQSLEREWADMQTEASKRVAEVNKERLECKKKLADIQGNAKDHNKKSSLSVPEDFSENAGKKKKSSIFGSNLFTPKPMKNLEKKVEAAHVQFLKYQQVLLDARQFEKS